MRLQPLHRPGQLPPAHRSASVVGPTKRAALLLAAAAAWLALVGACTNQRVEPFDPARPGSAPAVIDLGPDFGGLRTLEVPSATDSGGVRTSVWS